MVPVRVKISPLINIIYTMEASKKFSFMLSLMMDSYYKPKTPSKRHSEDPMKGFFKRNVMDQSDPLALQAIKVDPAEATPVLKKPQG